MSSALKREIERDRRRNREDIIRHARWEAEMARRLGREWYAARDWWLIQAHEAARELWKDPRVRGALIKALLRQATVEKGD